MYIYILKWFLFRYSIENAKPTPHGFDAREVHKVLDSSFVKVKEWEKQER